MAEQKIQYSDMFADDILAKINELTVALSKAGEQYAEMSDDITKRAKTMKEALSQTSGANAEQREKILALTTEVERLAKQLAELQKKETERKATLTELEKLEKQRQQYIQRNSEEYKKAYKAIESERQASANSAKQARVSAREAAATANSVEALRAKVARLTVEWANMNRNSPDFRKTERELKKITQELTAAEARAGKFSRGVGGYFGGIMKSAGKLAGMFGLGLGASAFIGVLKNATKTITDFEQANANLATILGKSRSEITALTESAKRLGATTEWMASQVTELQTELAKLGFNETQIQQMQASILQFATALGADLDRAASLAGASLRAFGLDASETERVTGVMAVGANKSALSFGYLETAMSTIAPVARSFGFGIEDTVALLGTLSDAGFDASTAATSTRNILLNLADANGKLAKQLGGPVKTIPELADALTKLRDKGVNLAETLELTDKRSVAAFNTFLQGTDSLRKLRIELNDTEGELERIQKEQLNTVEGSVKLLNSAWESLMLSFSNSAGFFKGLIDRFTEVVNWLNKVINKTEYLNSLYSSRADARGLEMAKDMEEQIRVFEQNGLSRERAIELMLGEWEKESKGMADLLKEQKKYLSFFDEADFAGDNGRTRKKRAEQAQADYNEMLVKYESFLKHQDQLTKKYTGVEDEPEGQGKGKGTLTDAQLKARKKLEGAELQSIRKMSELEVQVRMNAAQRIMNDERASFNERISAADSYYTEQEKLIDEAAANQKAKLIDGLLRDTNNGIKDEEQAKIKAAKQLAQIDKEAENKKTEATQNGIKARERLQEQATNTAIAAERNRLQTELALSKKWSDDELRIRLDLIENARKQAIEANNRLAKEQRQSESTIQAQYNKESLDLQNEFLLNREMMILDQSQALAQSEFDLQNKSEGLKTKFALEQERKRLAKILELRIKYDPNLTDEERKTMENQLKALDKALANFGKGFLGGLFGGKDMWEALGIKLDDDQKAAIAKGFDFVKGQLSSVMDSMMALADAAVESATRQRDAAQTRVDAEVEASKKGYANNADMAQKELELAEKNRQKALKQQQKLQKAQAALDNAQQVSSLITASAQIYQAFAKIPWGIPLAIAMIGTMFTSFAAAKIKAAQAAKASQEYGEGGYEFVDYGGSHASGNDIDFGTTPDGKRRKIERGEFWGIVRKSQVPKYRNVLPAIFDSLNKGSFENMFPGYRDVDVMLAGVGGASPTDLSSLEGDVRRIRQQGDRRIYVDAQGRTVIQTRNSTKIINHAKS